jgi:putative DNA primase/helicase
MSEFKFSVTNNTEAALAEAFADHHKGYVMYVAAAKKWFVRIPRRPHDNDDGPLFWEPDTKLQVLHLVQATCMNAATKSGDPTLARTLCSAATISAVERLARCQPRLAGTRAEVGLPPPKRRAKVGVG